MDDNQAKRATTLDYFKGLTDKVADASPQPAQQIGQRVRTLRKKKGLTLGQLSSLTGFDMELLADIEEDRIQPQLGTIIKLSKALDSALGRLVSGAGDKPYAVTRRDEQKTVSRSTSKKGDQQVYVYKGLASEVKGRHMEPLIVQLEENPEGELSVHEGEEFIYVLSGEVSLKIAKDKYDLQPGDSVYYQSTTPHLIAAKSGQATILAVIHQG
jgi:transcriptional regulator with XRE-family HTH domain